jgi:large subunit ribosomal protein L24
MIKLKLKSGDEVKVIAGKYKGKTGKIIQTFPKLNRVVVDGVNPAKRHLKTRRSGEKGQTVEFFMPMHASNVVLIGAGGKNLRHDDRPADGEVKKPAPKAKKAAKKTEETTA